MRLPMRPVSTPPNSVTSSRIDPMPPPSAVSVAKNVGMASSPLRSPMLPM